MVFSWMKHPGRYATHFTHSPESVVLASKTGEKQAFPEICKASAPPCNLTPFLFNGHLQTAWTALHEDGPPVYYKRRVFSAEDPAFAGHFAVDFVTRPPGTSSKASLEAELKEDPTGVGHYLLPERTTYFTNEEFEGLGSDDKRPIIIALHGLSGGSHEVYLRHVLAPLVAGTKDIDADGLSGGKWDALVVNSRGCAGSKVTSTILYNARATWDCRQVVRWCRRVWPNRPLFGVGFSLGANIMTNYVAEEGTSCPLLAAMVVSNPWQLETSSLALHRTFIGQEIYSKTLGGNMRALFEHHRDEILKNTDISYERLKKVKYLFEFDREVQCATWGYPTERAYYRDASSSDAVMDVRIPLMCLHAKDDPIASDEAVPYGEIRTNPWVVMCATGGGGHLGWYEFGGGRWHARAAANFFNAMRDIDFDKTEAPKGANESQGPHRTPFQFRPMRRKMHLPSPLAEQDKYQPDSM